MEYHNPNIVYIYILCCSFVYFISSENSFPATIASGGAGGGFYSDSALFILFCVIGNSCHLGEKRWRTVWSS